MKILNLGCGNDIREDCINMDIIKLKGVNVVHNLNKFPYPFEKNTFDKVYAFAILEHLPDKIKVMEELHRICKPNSKIFISVPFWHCRNAFEDPTHISFFSYDTFGFFEDGHLNCHYTTARFKVIKTKITGIRIFPDFLKKFLSDFIANIVVRLDFILEVKKDN